MREKSRVTKLRREYITENLEKNGEVSYSSIREEFPGVKRASILADVAAIGRDGPRIEVVGGKLDRKIIWEGSLTKKANRALWQIEEKKKIAKVAAGLILGFPKFLHRIGGEKRADDVNMGAILTELSRCQVSLDRNGASSNLNDLRVLLKAYWNSREKAFVIDSGSTNECVASELERCYLPTYYDLEHLTAYTNSRGIFSMLGKPECELASIVIGGRQRFASESICGDLARRTLKAWDPHFGMAIVGATGVDTNSLVLGSYNSEEAMMKSELLSRAEIRVVVADSSKFSRYGFEVTSKFCRIAPEAIDLIVTDKEPRIADIKPQKNHRTRNRVANDGESFQDYFPVPVLVADRIFETLRA